MAQADTGIRNDAGEDETQVAQARGGRGRVGPRAGENFETTPAQQARLYVAEAYARERLRQVQRFDPEWRPEPSFVQSAEGAIKRAEGEARAAESRMQELFRDAVPNSRPDWGFNRLTRELREQGYTLKGATDSPGQLLINPRTREEVRIMQRPQTRNRNDAPQKHLYEHYYRYRKADDQTFGAAIPIPDKPGVSD